MARHKTYPVVLRHSEEGYSVSRPGLPGCFSQGATEEEALRNIEDAICGYVEVAEEKAAGLTPEEFRKLL